MLQVPFPRTFVARTTSEDVPHLNFQSAQGLAQRREEFLVEKRGVSEFTEI